jgi:hypothetical protein
MPHGHAAGVKREQLPLLFADTDLDRELNGKAWPASALVGQKSGGVEERGREIGTAEVTLTDD